MRERRLLYAVLAAAALCGCVRRHRNPNPHLVVYQGDKGPGAGKHIVFLAGDQEYRGEETLPALARILARHYGFTCSVFFTTDPKTGFIDPGSSNIAGLEALKTADLLVVFLRFQDFPDDEMQHIVDYLDRGGPVIGSAHRDARVSDQAAGREVREVHVEHAATIIPAASAGRFSARRGCRTTAPTTSRARGWCCRPTRRASDPARRQGHVGAVGRLHRQSDCGQHGFSRSDRFSTA